MSCNQNKLQVMRYHDNEMTAAERAVFEDHLESCPECRETLAGLAGLKEVTDRMKIADLPEAVWERYWTGIYNRIERSVAWVLFIIGAVMMVGYSVYHAVIEPGIESFVRLALTFMGSGFAVLFLSVLREKLAVNRADRYISEVER
jgi:hypothetical protein